MTTANKNRSDRLGWFIAGGMTVGCIIMAGAGGVLKTVVPTNPNKLFPEAREYFMSHDEEGTTTYFWKLEVNEGTAQNGEIITTADVFFLGSAEAEIGGGFNQTDFDPDTGERLIFLQEGIVGQVIDKREE